MIGKQFEYQGERYTYPLWLSRIVKCWNIDDMLVRHCFRIRQTLEGSPQFLGRKIGSCWLQNSWSMTDFLGDLPYPFVIIHNCPSITTQESSIEYYWDVWWLEIRWSYRSVNGASQSLFDTITSFPDPQMIHQLPADYKREGMMCLVHAIYQYKWTKQFN